MLPELTPAVFRALELAKAYAAREKAIAVGGVHLLHGLLDEEEGLAAELARRAGLDWSAYRHSVSAPAVASSQNALPLQPATETAFRLARQLELELTGDR